MPNYIVCVFIKILFLHIAKTYIFVSMFKQINSHLSKPFPIIDSARSRIIMPISFGFFVFAFLFIFKPFGISTEENVLLITLGYGAITMIISFANNIVFYFLFSKLKIGNNYTLKHNLYISLWFLFTIGLANWIYANYILNSDELNASLFVYILYTVAVGIFPMIIGGYFTERKLNKQNNKTAETINTKIDNDIIEIKDTNFEFISELTDDRLIINSRDLICIKSDGNYCEFYFQYNKEIKRKILRYTMKMALEIVTNHPKIIRCHRSFFINIEKIAKVSGTARNLSLHIDNLEFSIPISRANEQLVTKAISHIHKNIVN